MILVTGGTGLLGSYLLLNLAETENNIPLVSTYRSENSIKKTETIFGYYNKKNLLKKIKWVEADIRDYKSIEKHINSSTYVYHLAAVVDFGSISAEEIFEINVKGTSNIVNACLNNDAKKLCFASSVAALGKSKSEDETANFNKAKANSIYSLSKYYAQQEVWRAYYEGLKTVIVNPSIILGAGNWNSGSSKLFSFAKKNKFYTEGITGYVDARDVTEIMIRLMKSDISGETYILNSENLSYKSVFTQIANALSLKDPKIKVGKYLMCFIWRIFALGKIIGLKPKITKEIAKASISKSFYSSKKISDKLNYNFIDISSSIKHIAEIYKNQFKHE